MNDYEKYVEIQKTSEDEHCDDLKNNSEEGHRFDPSNAYLIEMVARLNKKGRALDIGCCTGYHTEQLKDMLGEAYGIDINPRLIEIARSFGRDYCWVSDLHKLPFDDGFFDVVFAHEVLEHCFEFEKAISEINRVLKKDGYLVFSLPCEKVSKKQPIEENFKNSDPHFVKLTPLDLKRTIEATAPGLKVIYGDIFPIGDYRLPMPLYDVEVNYPFQPHLHAFAHKQ